MHFYKPMLAKSVSKPFSGKDWIFETKWDGFRAIAYVKDNLFTLQSRNGNEFKRNFPEIEEITQLAKNVVVDGEIVVMKQGKVDFHSLQERGHLISSKDIERLQVQSPATYIVFDILEKNGKPLVDLPLIERKAILKESVKEGSHVILNDYVEEKGNNFTRRFCSMTLKAWLPNAKTASLNKGLFERSRKIAVSTSKNPRLGGITFHTLRHWKATMEYHKTKTSSTSCDCLVTRTSRTQCATLNS